jgi:nicotinamidase-related amidase
MIKGEFIKVLVVVDMQNDFIVGVFGTNEAPLVVGAVQIKLNNTTRTNSR